MMLNYLLYGMERDATKQHYKIFFTMALSSPSHALLRGLLGCSCLGCVGAFSLCLVCFFSLPTSLLELDQPFLGQGSGCCLHPPGVIACCRRWLFSGSAALVVPHRLSEDIPLTLLPSQCVPAARG